MTDDTPALHYGWVIVLAGMLAVFAALGLGLSSSIPGRNPLLDGFGLIAFASLFPIMSVMGYAQLSEWIAHRSQKLRPDDVGD